MCHPALAGTVSLWVILPLHVTSSCVTVSLHVTSSCLCHRVPTGHPPDPTVSCPVCHPPACPHSLLLRGFGAGPPQPGVLRGARLPWGHRDSATSRACDPLCSPCCPPIPFFTSSMSPPLPSSPPLSLHPSTPRLHPPLPSPSLLHPPLLPLPFVTLPITSITSIHPSPAFVTLPITSIHPPASSLSSPLHPSFRPCCISLPLSSLTPSFVPFGEGTVPAWKLLLEPEDSDSARQASVWQPIP